MPNSAILFPLLSNHKKNAKNSRTKPNTFNFRISKCGLKIFTKTHFKTKNLAKTGNKVENVKKICNSNKNICFRFVFVYTKAFINFKNYKL